MSTFFKTSVELPVGTGPTGGCAYCALALEVKSKKAKGKSAATASARADLAPSPCPIPLNTTFINLLNTIALPSTFAFLLFTFDFPSLVFLFRLLAGA
jgi:hypothetical protein